MLFLCIVQDPLLAARLELRDVQSGSSQISAMVGEEIEFELFVDSESESLSGATIFLSFDEDVFELVQEDRDAIASGFQPFAPGVFLRNGEVFRNELLAADDPAASPAGAQLDFSVVRAFDVGAGPTAYLRLRAVAPTARSVVNIDETGIRETRFFTPDGSHRPFRFITPLSVTVQGITLEGLPSSIVLARGQLDSTSLRLDNAVFDPLYSGEEIAWSISSSSALSLTHDAEIGRVLLSAPGDESLWERVTLVATNPDGQSATAIVDVFVNAPPVLVQDVDVIVMDEDAEVEVPLEDWVDDPDSPASKLTWTTATTENLTAHVSGPPFVVRIQPDPDWSGEGQVQLVVADEFGFADSTAIPVSVTSINDAPSFHVAPNLQIIRGRQDSSLTMSALIEDMEDDTDDLSVTWSGEDQVSLELHGSRLFVSTPMDWMGTETITLRVEDSQGLTDTVPLTVTVLASLAPDIVAAPERLGLPPGTHSILELADLAADPDDQAVDLTWHVTGQNELDIRFSSSGAARIEAPADFTNTETLRFTVTDPTGETASFDLIVFAASAAGEPSVAPLPVVELPVGGIDASLDLDIYVFDLDHDPQQMEWLLPAVEEGIELRVDATTHVLTIAVAESVAPGRVDLELLVIDPDGNEARELLVLRIRAPEAGPGDDPGELEVPELVPIPALTVTSGEFDQSLIIDDFVSGFDPSTWSWEISGSVHTQVDIDPLSRQLTVLADQDWYGNEIIILRGTDPFGDVVLESFIGITVLPPPAELVLRDLLEIAVFAGDRKIEIDIETLTEGYSSAGLVWEADALIPLELIHDAQANRLTISTDEFPPGSEIITLTARNRNGVEATSRIVVEAYPVDGSYGIGAPSTLRLAVIPNPIQPAFVDIFAISERGGLSREPLLRVQDAGWRDLDIAYQSPGIWHGRYALPPASEGDFDILGLTIDADDDVIKSSFTLSVTAPVEIATEAGKALPIAGAIEKNPDSRIRAAALYRSYLGKD